MEIPSSNIIKETFKENQARIKKKYHQEHKEEIAIYKKQYYRDNKERIDQQIKVNRQIKTQCINCGATIAKHCMSSHRQTNKCKSFIKP